MTEHTKSHPPGTVSISVAAALIGVTPDRVGQLVRGGHAVSPGRGLILLPSLLRGYTAQLRTAAARPASAALARHQASKAALIADATEARQAELMPRADAEVAVDLIVDIATKHIRAAAKPSSAALRGLPVEAAAKLREELGAAADAISAAHATALRALETGDMSEVEG